ncbi:hypothetical protein BT63DRAFT_458144 [Microthyrium microscopicum]|uniref:Uncharacterized protein n=1 Tax=Microthyrium microscopicum TaxID=703497 RepID=A0A6A6U5I8_9PEZI|nr:hypothetical protein BT63DRAFT_458144 [Microthyrium microscopicum]
MSAYPTSSWNPSYPTWNPRFLDWNSRAFRGYAKWCLRYLRFGGKYLKSSSKYINVTAEFHSAPPKLDMTISVPCVDRWLGRLGFHGILQLHFLAKLTGFLLELALVSKGMMGGFGGGSPIWTRRIWGVGSVKDPMGPFPGMPFPGGEPPDDENGDDDDSDGGSGSSSSGSSSSGYRRRRRFDPDDVELGLTNMDREEASIYMPLLLAGQEAMRQRYYQTDLSRKDY